MKRSKFLAMVLAMCLLLSACGGASTMAENGAAMDKGYDTGANRADTPSVEVLEKEAVSNIKLVNSQLHNKEATALLARIGADDEHHAEILAHLGHRYSE